MKRNEIDGVRVIHEFKMYHHEWEADGYGWVTDDGRVWHTSHGGNPFEIEISDLTEKVDELKDAIVGIHKASVLIKDRKRLIP